MLAKGPRTSPGYIPGCVVLKERHDYENRDYRANDTCWVFGVRSRSHLQLELRGLPLNVAPMPLPLFVLLPTGPGEPVGLRVVVIFPVSDGGGRVVVCFGNPSGSPNGNWSTKYGRSGQGKNLRPMLIATVPFHISLGND